MCKLVHCEFINTLFGFRVYFFLVKTFKYDVLLYCFVLIILRTYIHMYLNQETMCGEFMHVYTYVSTYVQVEVHVCMYVHVCVN